MPRRSLTGDSQQRGSFAQSPAFRERLLTARGLGKRRNARPQPQDGPLRKEECGSENTPWQGAPGPRALTLSPLPGR